VIEGIGAVVVRISDYTVLSSGDNKRCRDGATLNYASLDESSLDDASLDYASLDDASLG
jgi:uncharacterized protein YjbI with pentapeptide repeats